MHIWWECKIVKYATTMKNGMAVLQNIKHRITIWTTNPTCGYTFKRTQRTDLSYLNSHAHRSIIYNSQNAEATSVHLQINEYAKCGTHPYTWNLFSLIKKEILTQVTMNELWVHYTKWNKSAIKGYLWFHFYEVPRMVKFTEIESRREDVRACGEKETGN